jgi:glutaredoxin-related protein
MHAYIHTYIHAYIHTYTQPVMLFMKGDPEAAKCGFSKTIVTLLKDQGIKFGYARGLEFRSRV